MITAACCGLLVGLVVFGVAVICYWRARH
jgi:hypothetical protein